MPPKGKSQRPLKGGEPTAAKGGETSEPAYLRRIREQPCRDIAAKNLPTFAAKNLSTYGPHLEIARVPSKLEHTSEYIKLHHPSRLSAAGEGLLPITITL